MFLITPQLSTDSNPDRFMVECTETIKKNILGSDRRKLLLQKETSHIHQMQVTAHPGLNKEIDCSPVLFGSYSDACGPVPMLKIQKSLPVLSVCTYLASTKGKLCADGCLCHYVNMYKCCLCFAYFTVK